MRKNIIVSVMLTLCVVVLAFACVKTDGVAKATIQNTNKEVLNVSQSGGVSDKVLETRFLNMLNHNYVYDDAFYDDVELVNEAMLALLDTAEGSFLEETYLSDYIFNMYGKVYSDFSFLGDNLPEKPGYVYILPRSYDEYSHTIISVTANADGSYTVLSDIAISTLEGVETIKCETLFLEAEESAFGYNILYSDIVEIIAAEADC